MNRYKLVLNILKVFIVIIVVLPISALLFHGCENKNNIVHYRGWDTRIMPKVYFRSVSHDYAYIVLFKREGFFKEKAKIISLEKPENLKLFLKFLTKESYDGMNNYISEDAVIEEKEE